MDNNSYRELVQSLNREQMGCFLPLLLSVKNADKQLTLFLSGGAGVGKRTVTHCLYEALDNNCARHQFNKTFTLVIYKCSYCFQPLKQWLHCKLHL